MKKVAIFAVFVLLTATFISGVGTTDMGAATKIAESSSQNALVLQLDLLDGLQDLIERIDEFLESIADLLKTLQELFGGEGGGDD